MSPTLQASDDAAKFDLELVCDECGDHLCDAEAGDELWALVSVSNEHEEAGHSAPLFVILTDDGAPMNDTAACAAHLADVEGSGLVSAAGADDAPENPEYVKVTARFAARNDTACGVCAALARIESRGDGA